MIIKEIFKELESRIGEDLIVSYSEVRELSKLSNKQFHKVYCRWENFQN